MAMITDNPVQDPAASDRIAQIQPCNYTVIQVISHHILAVQGVQGLNAQLYFGGQ